MMKYEILNFEGHKVGEQEMDDQMAPTLLAGQSARLIELDGERLARNSRPIVGPDQHDAEPHPPMPATLVTEAEAAAAREKARAEKEAQQAAEEAAKAKAAKAADDATKAKATEKAPEPPKAA